MVSGAQSGTVSSAGDALSREPTGEGAPSRFMRETANTGSESPTRCFLHELQDELIHLLVTFLGTPTQGSLLLSVTSRRLREAVVDERFWRQVFAGRFTGKLRKPSLWRYSCSEDPPLRPALLQLSSLSCCPPYTTDETPSPASTMDKSLLPASDDTYGQNCFKSARKQLNATGASSASGKPFPCNHRPSVSPLPFYEESGLRSPTTAGVGLNYRSRGLRVSGNSEEAFDSVLSAALKKAGVPSGGQCWRGKYFFKHALERKFTRGQFDVQHTWFPDNSPVCSPRSPDETSTAHSSQHGLRGGRNHSIIYHPFLGLTKASVHRKHLHQHHPGHLCVYRHPFFLIRRTHRHDPSVLKKMPRSVESCATDNVTGAATVPPVCVVGMKFFGDGAGLVYAARAGGVGAYCPDLGYKLRSFRLHLPYGSYREQDSGMDTVGVHGATAYGTREEEREVLSCGAARNSYDPVLMEEAPTTKESTESDGAYAVPDLSGEILPSPVEDFTNHRRAPLAVCVTHTIDEALCSGSRDLPLVLAGFSDGRVGIWDYRRPRTVLRCLDVSPTAVRGSVAVRSLCMVKNGPTYGAEVLAGAEDGRLSLLNIERSDAGIVQHLRGHTAAIQAISVHPDIPLSFTASRDRYVHMYDLRVGEMPVASCGRHHDWAMCVQVREGLGVNTFDTADRIVYTWDIRRLLSYSKAGEDSMAKPISERHHHRRLISGLRSDALRLVSCSLDGTVLVSSVECNHSSVEHNKGTGVPQLEAQHYSDFTVLRRGKEGQWLLGVDFAETKMATAAADGGIQIFHFLQLPTLPQCCLYN